MTYIELMERMGFVKKFQGDQEGQILASKESPLADEIWKNV